MYPVKMMIVNPWKKIIGRLKDESDFYEVEEPFVIEEVMSQRGMSVLPIPLVPTNDSKSRSLQIRKDHVTVLPFDPPEDLEGLYVQLTSNLVLPTSGGIIK